MTGLSLWSHYRHKHGAILFMCKTVRHAKCILLAKPEVQDNGMSKHWIHNLSLWFEVVHLSVWSSCLAVYCNLSRDIILGDLWSRAPDQEIKSTMSNLKCSCECSPLPLPFCFHKMSQRATLFQLFKLISMGICDRLVITHISIYFRLGLQEWKIKITSFIHVAGWKNKIASFIAWKCGIWRCIFSYQLVFELNTS